MPRSRSGRTLGAVRSASDGRLEAPLVTTPVETAPQASARPRSPADRIARQILRVEGAEPRTLMPLKGSLLISAIRCVITYAVVPALAPVVSGSGMVATPLSLALAIAAGVMAVVSLRRVWLADWARRWAYTGFIVVVLVLLAVAAAFDVRTLLG